MYDAVQPGIYFVVRPPKKIGTDRSNSILGQRVYQRTSCTISQGTIFVVEEVKQ
jgi:hypothetical protein